MTQSEALTLLKMGKNVFLTGAAGSGKTYVLNQYIDYLKTRGVEVAITASTGIAATHIGGMTIHSWSGIGIKDYLSQRDLDYLEQKPYLWKRFEHVKVLIIDEISMLKDTNFDMVDRVCKTFKRNNLPFGGIQLVCSGDFFQLPPIDKGTYAPAAPEIETVTISFDGEDDMSYEMDADTSLEIRTPFVFKSKSWKEAQLHVCYLEEQHRQDDEMLLRILNEIRTGEVSDMTRERLLEQLVEDETCDAPKIFTHNTEVDRYNSHKLSELKTPSKKYDMTSNGKASGVQALVKGCLSPEVLHLKVGALVMFVKNNPIQGYVNGTVGEIVGFEDDYPVVETRDDRCFVAQPQSWVIEDQGITLAEISQVPLKLAWAVTIHKSQGMTLDTAHIDLSNAFVPGQGYVALSRVRTLDGLMLKGINRQALEVHPGVLDFDLKLKEASDILSKRIAKTDASRIKEMCDEFLKSVGGTEKFVKKTSDPKAKKEKKNAHKTTYQVTKELLEQKLPLSKIAQNRKLAEGTILEHVEKLLDQKMITLEDIEYLKPKAGSKKKILARIADAFDELETRNLKPIFDHFEQKYDYDMIKLARLFCART